MSDNPNDVVTDSTEQSHWVRNIFYILRGSSDVPARRIDQPSADRPHPGVPG